MYSKFIAGSIITAAFFFAGAYAADQPATPGEKIESGVGALPPYGGRSKHPDVTHMVIPDEMAPAVMVVARKSK